MANVLIQPVSGAIQFNEQTAGGTCVPDLSGGFGIQLSQVDSSGLQVESHFGGLTGGTRFSVQGDGGQLLGVTDALTGDVFSVNDASGLPIINVNSCFIDVVKIGTHGTNALVVSGGNVGIGTSQPSQQKLTVAGGVSAIGLSSMAVNKGFVSAGRDLSDIFATTAGSGFIDGTGTAHKIPVWSDSNTLGDSPLSTNGSSNVIFPDNVIAKFGSDNDLYVRHTGSTGFVSNNTGDFYIENSTNDGDILFRSDDGSGDLDNYIRIDGGSHCIDFYKDTHHSDGVIAKFGTGSDLLIQHDGNHSYVYANGTGDLRIEQYTDNTDICLSTDDGYGNTVAYVCLDGSEEKILLSPGLPASAGEVGIGISPTAKLHIPDDALVGIGSGTNGDLQIKHTSDNSYIENTTGDLFINNTHDDKDIIFRTDNGSGGMATYLCIDGTNNRTTFPANANMQDNVRMYFGSGLDMQIYHDSSSSIIQNDTGHLDIKNTTNDGDIRFYADNGYGGDAEYARLDGGAEQILLGAGLPASAGEVGIGTTSPESKLHVAGGDIRLDNAKSLLGETNAGGNFQMVKIDTSDNMLIGDGNISVDITGTSPRLIIDSGGTVTTSGSLSSCGGITSCCGTIEGKLVRGTSCVIATKVDSQYVGNTAETCITSGCLGCVQIGNSKGMAMTLSANANVAQVGIGMAPTEALQLADSCTLALGTGGDLQIYHNGSHSYIRDVGTGGLYLQTNGPAIYFQDTDGNPLAQFTDGGSNFLMYDGSIKLTTKSNGVAIGGSITNSGNISAIGGLSASSACIGGNVKIPDSGSLLIGDSNDLELGNDGSASLIDNNVSHLYLRQQAADKDIIFQADDGSGTATTYFMLDGSAVNTCVCKSFRFADNVCANFGNSSDLRLKHDGSNVYFQNTLGDFYISNTGSNANKDIVFFNDDGYGNCVEYLKLDGGSENIIMSNGLPSSAGEVGIHTNTPAYRLDIGGESASVCNTLRIGNENNGTAIRIGSGSGSGNTVLMRVDGNSPDGCHDGASDNSNYGFSVKYCGGNSGNKNTLHILSDNQTGTQCNSFTMSQSGDIGLVGVSDPLANLHLGDGHAIGLGNGPDIKLLHNGTTGYIQNFTGDFRFEQQLDDGDMEFYSDDGSGSIARYFHLDGGLTCTIFSKNTRHSDNVAAYFGAGGDLQIFNDSADSIIRENTRHLCIQNTATDGDIIFVSDDGSGGEETYFQVDGGYGGICYFKSTLHADGVQAGFGTGNDMQIQHNGADGFITNSTGEIRITPNEQLTVVGNISAHGSLSATGAQDNYFKNKVGIGTPDPQDKFHVCAGSVRIDSGYAFCHDACASFMHYGDWYFCNNVGDIRFDQDATNKDIIFCGDQGSGKFVFACMDMSAEIFEVKGAVKKTTEINAQTVTAYTLTLADQSRLVTSSHGSAQTITVPPNSSVAFPTGSEVTIAQYGAGQVTIAAGSGVTLYAADSELKTRVQYSTAVLTKIATDTWLVAGDLTA